MGEWIDYKIIHTGDGFKLERWGEQVLLRPDPQIIWSPTLDMAKYDTLNMIYSRSSEGGGAWTTIRRTPSEWQVRCNISDKKFAFLVKPMGFKHTGLFPEQITNWQSMHDVIANDCTKGNTPSVLNLFGYTGAASVVCASAGATVCHVDAAKNMVERCKQNANINNIPSDKIRYIVDDCLKFVLREQKRGKTYNAIIMDPPSYGRGPNGEMWRIEDGINDLVRQSARLLDKPLFFLINSYTTGLQPLVLHNLLGIHLPKGKITAYEVGLPTEDRGIVLPCGCSGLWRA